MKSVLNVLKDLLKSRIIQFSLIGCILFCLGLHLYTQWDLKRFEASLQKETPSTLETSSPAMRKENAQGAHFHADDTWHEGPHETPLPPPTDVFGIDAEKRSHAFVSSNPLMPNQIPEHLQMPSEWQNWYYLEAYEDPTSKAKYEQRLEQLTRSIVQDYNPGRPLEEMWPAFIEAEKQLMTDSPYDEENFGIPSLGGYRADWLYQQIWNFPEVFDRILSEGKESPMWVNVFHIDMGFLEPDWNVFRLHDGREFRTKETYRYKFVAEYDEKIRDYRINYGYAYGDIRNAETLTVDLDTLSEIEFEAIQGYNYNINPYTQKPTF